MAAPPPSGGGFWGIVMILSNQNLFCDSQYINATDSYVDEASDNYIDLREIGAGPGTPIPLLIQVTEYSACNGGVSVYIESSDDPAFGSFTTHGFTELHDEIELGSILPIDKLPESINERYVRLYFYGYSGFTSLRITAGITMGNQHNGG